MTQKCINTLKKLRDNNKFSNLSLEQLLYECLKANQWDKKELVYIINSLIKEKEIIEKLE